MRNHGRATMIAALAVGLAASQTTPVLTVPEVTEGKGSGSTKKRKDVKQRRRQNRQRRKKK